MPDQPPDIEGFARAHERTMQRFAEKAEALFPDVAHPSRHRMDVGDLFNDYPLGLGAIRTPWWRWEVALGTMRPRSANPLHWAWFVWRVRFAKRSIRLAHDRNFGYAARRLSNGR